MANLRLKDPEAYPQRLRSDPLECDRLIEAVVIKVSSFFRDPIVFELLAQRILPRIMDRHRQEHTRQIRVWSAGCSTGEEAYSVAILLAQALEDEDYSWLPYICATDISPEALAVAQTGSYRRERWKPPNWGSWTACSGPRPTALKSFRRFAGWCIFPGTT